MDRAQLPPGLVFLAALAVSLALLPPYASAWTGTTHEYLCPEGYGIDCGIADHDEFKGSYPYGEYNHLCYDNKSYCTPRLLAGYYLKKYYLEGRQDRNLLGAAAHLMQDAACPAHWFPMRQLLGMEFTILGPPWVLGLEGLADMRLREGRGWSIPIEFQGRPLDIDQAYMDGIKDEVRGFISQEPGESLEELEARLKEKDFWMYVRGFREAFFIVAPVILLLLAYDAWKWRRGKKQRGRKSDLIESAFLMALLLALLVMIALGLAFY